MENPAVCVYALPSARPSRRRRRLENQARTGVRYQLLRKQMTARQVASAYRVKPANAKVAITDCRTAALIAWCLAAQYALLLKLPTDQYQRGRAGNGTIASTNSRESDRNNSSWTDACGRQPDRSDVGGGLRGSCGEIATQFW